MLLGKEKKVAKDIKDIKDKCVTVKAKRGK